MLITIKAKTQAKETKVEKIDEMHYKVSVKAPPHEGKANAAVIKALADFFDVPKSRVRIVRGENGREKVVEVM